MANLTIYNIDEALTLQLQSQATLHNRSAEEEAHDILRVALNRETLRPDDLAASIRARFGRRGGVELPAVPREPPREPPTFDL